MGSQYSLSVSINSLTILTGKSLRLTCTPPNASINSHQSPLSAASQIGDISTFSTNASLRASRQIVTGGPPNC